MAEDLICLEFFGIELLVAVGATDPGELQFRFGPHVVADSGRADRMRVELGAGGRTDYLVRRADGAPLLRRAFRGWSNVPAVVPPLAAAGRRYAHTPAVVLARGTATVALTGAARTDAATVAVALAQRGWRFVSGGLLVWDRRTGETLPYHVPLQVGGPETLRAIGVDVPATAWRARRSPLTGETLEVRTDALGTLAPIRSRLRAPTCVRLCRGDTDRVRLTSGATPVLAWPAEASAQLTAPVLRLELSASGGAEEAAGLLDDHLCLAGDDRASAFRSPAREPVPG